LRQLKIYVTRFGSELQLVVEPKKPVIDLGKVAGITFQQVQKYEKGQPRAAVTTIRTSGARGL
jgi:hypothetical protein